MVSAIWRSTLTIGLLISLLACQSIGSDSNAPSVPQSEIEGEAPDDAPTAITTEPPTTSPTLPESPPPLLPASSSEIAESDVEGDLEVPPLTTNDSPTEEQESPSDLPEEQAIVTLEPVAADLQEGSEERSASEIPAITAPEEALLPLESSAIEEEPSIFPVESLAATETEELPPEPDIEEPSGIFEEGLAIEGALAALQTPEPEAIQNDLLTEEQQALLARARALQEAGYVAEALALLEERLTANVDHPPLNRSVALLAEALSQYATATNFWEANLEAPSPYDREARAALLRNAVAQEDAAAALLAAQEMLVRGETPPIEELLYLAETSLRNEQYDQAARWYSIAQQQYPAISQYDRLLWGLGQLEENNPALRNMNRALSHYTEIVEQYPLSEYWEMARARSIYIRRHFFDVR